MDLTLGWSDHRLAAMYIDSPMDNSFARFDFSPARLQADMQREASRWRRVIRADRRQNAARLQANQSFCWGCGITWGDRKLQKCGACKIARYCNGECQRRHWQEHKLQCDVCRLRLRPLAVSKKKEEAMSACLRLLRTTASEPNLLPFATPQNEPEIATCYGIATYCYPTSIVRAVAHYDEKVLWIIYADAED